MILTLHTDYALRTLLFVAHAAKQVSVSDVADAYGISREHLFKVVQALVRLGYLHSRSGRGGGIWLARKSSEIVVGDVVADFEGRNGVLPCVGDPGYCVLGPGCSLRHALIDAENSFYAALGKFTFADLIAAKGSTGSTRFYELTIGRRTSAPAPSDHREERVIASRI
jgi:Rrf2 family nitric oxide-sensitive transcriptional repressor